ncbi:MAG TPA: hypothetical protein VN258_01785 [Mobilitalea sp.]|nr:hypothetical protein [Mobilitalea sp.]
MKKILSVFMAIALISTLLTACSKKAADENVTTDTNTTTASATSAPEATQAPVATEAVAQSPLPDKLDNPNITILWHTSEDQYKANLEANPNTFDAVWSVKEAFEQKYGGTVNVIAVGWGDQKDTLVKKVNAGEAVDLAQANDQNFPVYPAKKLVQDISQYVDVNDTFWNPGVTKAFSFGGTVYAAGVDAIPVVIYYNKTLFDNFGVKVPMDYYKEGNWTWDTFREAALAMTGDSDGDSVTDTFGFGWWDSAYVQFLATDGITNMAYKEDGSIGSNYSLPQATETMTFLQNAFVKDKFIDASQTGDYFINLFKSGKLAMTCEYGFNGFGAYASDYEIGWAPLPKGPSGQINQGGGGMSGWCIPVTSTNGAGAAAFMRMSAEMLKEFNNSQLLSKYGQEDIDLMNTLAENIQFAPIGIDGYWDANATIYQGLINGTPVSSFLTTADEQITKGAKTTLEQ